jgi:hypothetical protein
LRQIALQNDRRLQVHSDAMPWSQYRGYAFGGSLSTSGTYQQGDAVTTKSQLVKKVATQKASRACEEDGSPSRHEDSHPWAASGRGQK